MVEARPGTQGHSWLNSKCEASLGYMKPCSLWVGEGQWRDGSMVKNTCRSGLVPSTPILSGGSVLGALTSGFCRHCTNGATYRHTHTQKIKTFKTLTVLMLLGSGIMKSHLIYSFQKLCFTLRPWFLLTSVSSILVRLFKDALSLTMASLMCQSSRQGLFLKWLFLWTWAMHLCTGFQ